jgi:hypothetical protein
VNVTKQNSTVIVGWVAFNSTTGAAVLPPVTTAQSVPYGSPYILRIDVANASGARCQNTSTGTATFVCPTGTVTLLDNGAALNDFPSVNGTPNPNVANLNDRGYIEDQPIQLNAGTHNITATYTADASSSYNSQSTSNTLSVTITKATTTTAVTSTPSVVISGGSVTLTANVSSASNSSQGPTGTVQFKSGSSNLGSATTCTPAGATSLAGASCKATMTTTLSALPPGFLNPPQTPSLPLYLVYLASLCALLSLFLATKLSQRRRVYAYLGLILVVALAGGIAGCSGSGSGGGGGGSRNITGAYGGDSNYAASTSAATTVTVQ